MAFAVGTTWSPRVTVPSKDAPKELPVNSTNGSFSLPHSSLSSSMAAHKRAPAPDTFFFCDLLPLAPPLRSAMSPKISKGSSTPPPVQGAGRRRFLPPVADRPDAMASSARALARSSSFAAKAFSMIASHSKASIRPSPEVSRVLIDFSIFSGINRSWRFWLPQSLTKAMTSWFDVTPVLISSWSNSPDASVSMRSKTLRAAAMNSAVKAPSSAAAARARRSRSSASCARRTLRPRWIASSHSSTSTSPSCDVSSALSARSNRFGSNKNCKFSSPQSLRKSMTSLSLLTLFLISSFVSVPELSTSIISKTFLAADRNSAENSSSAAAAALARRSCSAFRSAVRFSKPL
mmetsp:Transcript_1274/g.3733  ORF Transcript_1274/g.3733 Transcript_1274/m.3733 type:complete len:348 (-) Transcript_1274:204-1247(-)